MSTPKAGSVARRAVAKEAEASAPVDLDVMLGNGPTVNLCGREFRIHPVPLMNHARLQEAMSVLGEEYLMPALAQDNPGALGRLARLLDAETQGVTPEDIATSMRMASASLTPEQIEAMLDICEIAFNPPDTVDVTRETIGRHVSAPAFPAILRAVLDCSGLNPTPPR
ncbi:MAG TPA: hypothetical protein VGM37_10455 [Armatimonadota bacterium]|jgi:hypothetical protein